MIKKKIIEKNVVDVLKEKGLTITTAESCTGGLVAATIVNISGASAVFKEGYITYSNEAKIKLLGVKPETLERYYAVSRETAIEMAQGGANNAGADVCVAVTGVAGPDKEDGKPVGLVYVSCCYNERVEVRECHFKGDRTYIRVQAVNAALGLVLEMICDK